MRAEFLREILAELDPSGWSLHMDNVSHISISPSAVFVSVYEEDEDGYFFVDPATGDAAFRTVRYPVTRAEPGAW